MKYIKILGVLFSFFLFLFFSLPLLSCQSEKDDDEDKRDTNVMVYKPNIYIYPTEQIELNVKIFFPKGGNIITSIPEYKNDWNLIVDTSGLINNSYSFLFYESEQPDIWQTNFGWIIQKDKLELFFRKNMTEYGFNEKEIYDFVEYWVPRLVDFPIYSIYPQTKNIIDNVIQLDFSIKPNNVLRLFYIIKGENQIPTNLVAPTIGTFDRKGYFVTEWGVILK